MHYEERPASEDLKLLGAYNRSARPIGVPMR